MSSASGRGAVFGRRAALSLGVLGAGGLLSACASTPALTHPLPTDYPSAPPATDVAAAALLYAVEAALLSATATAVSTAVSGRYTLPPALTAALGAAADHHGVHLTHWKSVLLANGYAPPSQSVLTTEPAQLGQARSAAAATAVLATLQSRAVATYFAAAARLGSAAGRATLALIAPVEAAHGATWDLLAGRPVSAPDSAQPFTLPGSGH